jgi:phenylacetaldehyde dehydrogenase
MNAVAQSGPGLALANDLSKIHPANAALLRRPGRLLIDGAWVMGPLVSAVQRDRVMKYVGEGLSRGAKALAGGRALASSGYYVEPTVFTQVSENMSIVREEIFGPVVVAQPFDSLDEIARIANDSIYGLGVSIWSKDVSKVFKLSQTIRANSVVKRCTATRKASRCASISLPSENFGYH